MRNTIFSLIFAAKIDKMAMNSSNLVRFDWAIKRLLRDKANYVVLEGFLSVLLEETVKIRQILSSQANKETSDDKYNDVDILVENTKRELIIIEVQNTKEYDYFQRILYGTSKVISEYIKEGKPYSEVKKVISITIAYFDLGQGEDYVYHGTTSFKGIHKGDLLTLSEKQVELYNKEKVYEIYPEYWIIKAGIFDEAKVNDKLDEWIFFFKTGEVKDEFSAPGLSEAKVKLNKLKLKPKERKEYEAYLERLRRIASQQHTQMADAQDLILAEKKGEENKEIEAIIGLYENGVPITIIAKSLKISEAKVLQVIEEHKVSK
jgi:predicted transposase/invertase (TIGR01784 family)